MVSFRDTFHTASQSLLGHPLRSGLTMLGVIIGNAAFVAMASLGESAKVHTIRRLEAFHGPNRLIAYASFSQSDSTLLREPKLNLSDSVALAQGVPAVRAVAPVVGQMLPAQSGDQSIPVWVTGTTSDYLRVKNENVAQGRFFNLDEVDQRARVVVLGSSISRKLYPDINPIGQSVAIKAIPFRVVGVMKEKGSVGDSSPDEFVYVPISTFSVSLRGSLPGMGIPVDYIEISANSKSEVDDAIFQATNLLHTRRGVLDFRVSPNIPYKDLISQVSSTLTIFLAVLAGISLLIGGIGIMNVMLVTVSERTSEIGLRKAIGATNSSILMSFLIEATLLSAAGGLIGVAIGVGIVVVVVIVSPLPFVVPAWALLTSILLSGGVGLISGVSPALRAARLDPIVALRST